MSIEQPHSRDDYCYSSSDASHTSSYLWRPVFHEIESVSAKESPTIFELGCGNGALMAELVRRGFNVTGVDPSVSGIAHASSRSENLRATVGSAYDDLASQYGQFDVVISLEVVEHVYSPRAFAKTLYSLVRPGGLAIVSTPYHGYVKNVALALSGKLDAHFTALWDHGHIKFWSVKTLTTLLNEAGFDRIDYRYAGRVPMLAKSMIAVAHRPIGE